MRTLTLFVLLFGAAHAASVPSADYVRSITPNVLGGVGNIGGITFPTGTARNIVDYGADNTGVTACDSAFAYAYAACGDGDYVYFPAGTYKFTSSPYINISNRYIIGAGSDLVTINFVNASLKTGFVFASGSQWTNPVVDNTVLSGLTQGSTSVTVGSSSGFNNNWVGIFFSQVVDQAQIEAGEPPTFRSSPGGDGIRHYAKVTSVSGGNTINFDPPILHAPPSGQTAYVRYSQTARSNVGIQGVKIDGAGADTDDFWAIRMSNIYNGFMRDVYTINNRNGIYITDSIYFEARECIFEDSSYTGILMHGGIHCLTEDNIFDNADLQINFNTAGSVVAYNFITGSTSSAATLNINHGENNHWNVYEGNIAPKILSDGFFGPSIRDAIFRNWITGRPDYSNTALLDGMIELKRFNRKASVVGNYIGTTASSYGAGGNAYINWGTPNIGNTTYSGEAQPTLGSWWRDFDPATGLHRSWTGTVASGGGTRTGVITMDDMGGTFGFANHVTASDSRQTHITWSGGDNRPTIIGTISGDNAPVTLSSSYPVLPANGTVVTFIPLYHSFQELDLDVAASAYVKKNYHLYTGGALSGIPSGEEDIGSDTVPNSLFRSEKPAWFGDKPWPLFDTARATQPNYTDLPAAHRYINGNTSYMPSEGGAGSATVTTANIGTLNISAP